MAPGTTRLSHGIIFSEFPSRLNGFESLSVKRGAGDAPGAGYSFNVQNDGTLYIFVHKRGTPTVPKDWEKTDLKAMWPASPAVMETDEIYKIKVKKGQKVEIPPHDGKTGSAFGLPHFCAFEKN